MLLANEIKTGNAKDDFKSKVRKIISLSISSPTINNGIDDKDRNCQNCLMSMELKNIKLKAVIGTPRNKDYEKACKDLYVKKVLESITIEDMLSGTKKSIF